MYTESETPIPMERALAITAAVLIHGAVDTSQLAAHRNVIIMY